MTSTDATRVRRSRRPASALPPWAWWLVDAVLIVAVTLVAIWLRLDPMGPSSLWLDDAWVALVSRTDGLAELRYVGFSAPGFAVLLRAWFGLVGFSEAAAQALPFLAGITTPGLAYLVARRFGWYRSAGLVAAVVLAWSPLAMDYATRVKQYTIESLLALVLVALAVYLLDEVSSRRRWTVFLSVAALATMVSAFLAPYAAAAAAAAMVRALRAGDRLGATRTVLAAGVYGVFAGAWYLVVLAPAVTTSISGFWSGHFLVVTDGFGPALASVRDAATGVAAGLVGVPAFVTLVALVVAVVALAVQRVDYVVLLVTPTLVAVVLAAAQLAPLGGGRTDIYLYPSLALLLAGGLDGLVRRRHGTAGWVLAAVITVGLAVTAQPITPYPRHDVRPLVAELEDRREPGDAVLVYPATMWAYALYTSDDISLEEEPVSAWGFAPRFADEATYVLPRGRDDPEAYAPTVAELAEREDRFWLVATHWQDDYEDLQDQLRRAGFERVDVQTRPGAELSRWERS